METLIQHIYAFQSFSVRYLKQDEDVLDLSPKTEKKLVNIKDPSIIFDNPLEAWEAKANPVDFEVKNFTTIPKEILSTLLVGRKSVTPKEYESLENFLALVKELVVEPVQKTEEDQLKARKAALNVKKANTRKKFNETTDVKEKEKYAREYEQAFTELAGLVTPRPNQTPAVFDRAIADFIDKV